MRKRLCLIFALSILVLALLACRLAGQPGQGQAEPTGLPTASLETATPASQESTSRTATPVISQASTTSPPDLTPTQALGASGPAPETGGTVPSEPVPIGPVHARGPKPPQSQAAEIRPTEMRSSLTHLSQLLGLRVLDEAQDELGLASDYIVNTCETYLLYILLEPAAGLASAPGSRVIIPYEALTVNSGLLDAQARSIRLRLLAEQLVGAPVFSPDQSLTPTDWEGPVRDFWSKHVRIGSLKTSCNVPGGPVYKVAYASQLLSAPLFDGRGELLGTVEEAILAPESGKLGFYLVRPAQGEGWVMVRLAATNIPKEALAPGERLRLVLLAEPGKFWEAPRLASLDEADNFMMQGKMLQYWDR